MAKLPTRDSLGPAPNVSHTRPIPTINLTTAGEGMAAGGASIARAGEELLAFRKTEQERNDAFDAQRIAATFTRDEARNMEEERRQMEAGGENFSTNWRSGYDGRAREAFATARNSGLSPRALQHLDLALLNRGETLQGQALTHELNERNRFHTSTLRDELAGYIGEAERDPSQLESALERGLAQIQRSRIDRAHVPTEERAFRRQLQQQWSAALAAGAVTAEGYARALERLWGRNMNLIPTPPRPAPGGRGSGADFLHGGGPGARPPPGVTGPGNPQLGGIAALGATGGDDDTAGITGPATGLPGRQFDSEHREPPTLDQALAALNSQNWGSTPGMLAQGTAPIPPVLSSGVTGPATGPASRAPPTTVIDMGDDHFVIVPSTGPDGRELTPVEAEQRFRQAGGLDRAPHFGVFSSEDTATRYSERLAQGLVAPTPAQQGAGQGGQQGPPQPARPGAETYDEWVQRIGAARLNDDAERARLRQAFEGHRDSGDPTFDGRALDYLNYYEQQRTGQGGRGQGEAPPGLAEAGTLPTPPGATATTTYTTVDGEVVVIPATVNGRRVTQARAIERYLQTQEHFGIFENAAAATAHAQQLSRPQSQRNAPAGGQQNQGGAQGGQTEGSGTGGRTVTIANGVDLQQVIPIARGPLGTGPRGNGVSGLSQPYVSAFARMLAAMPPELRDQIEIASAHRSSDHQAELYRRFQTGQGGRAAPPGHSRHEFGEALDLSPRGGYQNQANNPRYREALQWLYANSERFGLVNPPSIRGDDPHHFELTAAGRRQSGGPVEIALGPGQGPQNRFGANVVAQNAGASVTTDAGVGAGAPRPTPFSSVPGAMVTGTGRPPPTANEPPWVTLARDIEEGRAVYTGPARDMSLTQLTAASNAIHANYRRQVTPVMTQLNTWETGARNGNLPTGDVLAEWQERVELLGDREVTARFNSLIQLANDARRYNALPPNQLAEIVRAEETRQQTEGASPLAGARLAYLRTRLNWARTEIERDPLAWANTVGNGDFSAPIDRIFASDASMQEHAAAARRVAALLGQPTIFFTAENRNVAVDILRQGGPRALEMMSSMVRNWGGPDSQTELLRLAPHDPELAFIGTMYINAQASRNTVAMRAVEDAMHTLSLRRDPNSREQMQRTQPTAVQERDAASILGTVYQLSAPDRAAAINTANLIYFARASLRPSGEFNQDLWRQGLREALGENAINATTYGGIYHQGRSWFNTGTSREILIPPNIQQNAMPLILNRLRIEHLTDAFGNGPASGNGTPLTMAQLRAETTTLVSAGPGRYYIALGDPTSGNAQWVQRGRAIPGAPSATGADNRFVLDLNTLEPTLRRLMPQIYSDAPPSGIGVAVPDSALGRRLARDRVGTTTSTQAQDPRLLLDRPPLGSAISGRGQGRPPDWVYEQPAPAPQPEPGGESATPPPGRMNLGGPERETGATGPTVVPPEHQQALAGLNGVQRSFLSALDLAERSGAGGTAMRLYNDVVQRGRTAPITEGDLSEQDIEQLRAVVTAHAARTGGRSGSIGYRDYGSTDHGHTIFTPGLSQIFGGFRYSIDGSGNITIRDTYDFNRRISGDLFKDSRLVQFLAAFTNPVGLAANIGRRIRPDDGRGVPVQVTIRPPRSNTGGD